MAPAPGSSPPLSPLPSTASSPPPHGAQDDYAHLVRSLQRRSADRLRTADEPSQQRVKATSPVPQDLEADLRLAAEIGQSLLRDKTALQQRVEAAEKANQKLLDRLTASVKESSQLQRRLEETVGSLEQADASNRALLVSLEEDRKTISRLSVDSGKLVLSSTKLKELQRTHEDTVQELASTRKRADAVESKNRKLGERTAELEVRLKKALEDLEELRQDKVLRSRRSHDTLSKLRARYAKGAALPPPSPLPGEAEVLSENTEAKELLKMVETLVEENTMLRSESMELHGLLETARDEQVDLRSAMAAQEIFPEEEEDGIDSSEPTPRDKRRHSLASTFSASQPAPPTSDSIVSPSVSQALTDYDFHSHRPDSPSSTHATSFNRSWGPSASLSHSHRAVDLSRTLSGSSLGSGDDHAGTLQQVLGASSDKRIRRTSLRRPPPVSSASTGMLSGGKVPVGRGHARRAMSMDVTSFVRANPLTQDLASAPNSPNLDYSPSQRPPSLFSVASEGSEAPARPRRHHRPLSLSLGPSVFPQVPEDEQQEDRPISPFTRQPSHCRRVSQISTNGLGISSPALSASRRGWSSQSPERTPVTTVDSGTQTTPPATPVQLPRLYHPSTSTPSRNSAASLSRDHSPRTGPTASSRSIISELSDDRSFELSASPGGAAPSASSGGGAPASPHQPSVEQRTAVLGQLIDHVVKLLSRVQAADIATQEKRLKKQNLAGEVRHVAQANLRDLNTDIDAVRHHFRRIVELERSALLKDAQSSRNTPSPSLPNQHESLVTRRDFVSLVKLLRDLLIETTRLRSIVNRVQLDPSLASTIRELDVPAAVEAEQPAAAGGKATTSGGLLAPLSRLFGSTLSPDEPTLSRVSSSAQLRPPPAKRGGSSTVSTATVNVEFGSGVVRQSASATPDLVASTSGLTPARPEQAPRRVKREISSIFAGASTRSASPASTTDPRVVVPSAQPSNRLAVAASTASNYIPFGRLLPSFRPPMSATANAVLDSIPHDHSSSAIDDEPAPTLLERQLRPRGLSDSSIRSTFLSHGGASRPNPHHRIISPASLAISSEPTAVDSSTILSTSPAAQTPGGSGGLGALDALRTQLSEANAGGTVSRRPSAANLRAKASSSRLRESAVAPPELAPPVPSVPNILSTSTSTADSSLLLAGALSRSSGAGGGDSSATSRSPTSEPIRIAPPSPRKGVPAATADEDGAGPAATGGATGLFGTMVSSAWGSLAGPAAAPATTGGGKAMKGVPESWKENGRFG
ncbi:hypothetical protein JCM6882_008494 [Rhodosporidiobolus microsporus]